MAWRKAGIASSIGPPSESTELERAAPQADEVAQQRPVPKDAGDGDELADGQHV